MRVHFSKLFMFSEQLPPQGILFFTNPKKLSDYTLEGVAYEDGYVHLIDPPIPVMFFLMQLNSKDNTAREYLFQHLSPDGCFEVELTESDETFTSKRFPQSFAVPVEVAWVDYDQFRQCLYTYSITRKAFETEYELDQRLLTDSKLVSSAKFSKGINGLIVSLEGENSTVFNLTQSSEIHA